MGSQCVSEAKKPQKQTNKKTKQIQQSKINFMGSKSTFFSSLTCPIENNVIIDTAEKLDVFKEYQNQQVKWYPITFGNFTQKIYGTCEWVPGQPKTIHGKGSIYTCRINSQFLVTGKFQHGAIISKESYIKIFSNGTYYRGHLNSNLQGEGEGEIVYNQEERYKGSFVKGIPHGQGQFFGNNKHFKGTVSFGQKVKGIEKSPYGQYTGTFSENMRDGQGTLILNNGLKYEGKFSKNKREGFGTLYTKSGKVQYSGEWRQDKKVK